MTQLFYLRHKPSNDLDELLTLSKTARNSLVVTGDTARFHRLRNLFGRKYPMLLIHIHQPTMEDYNAMARLSWTMIHIRLDKKHLPKIQEFLKSHDNDPENVLQEIMSLGYKVSMSFIDDRASFVVTMSGTDRTKHNDKMSVSSWSDDFWEAVTMMGYKHFVICDGKSWEDHDTSSENWG